MAKSKKIREGDAFEHQWMGYPCLKSIINKGMLSNILSSDLVTSIDKILEIKNITNATMEALANYKINDDNELNYLKIELEKIKQELKDISYEFESAANQIDDLRRKVKIYAPVEDRMEPIDQSEIIHKRSHEELKEPDDIPVFEKDIINFDKSVNFIKNDSNIPEIEQLIAFVRSRGISVEDLRGSKGGGNIYISLHDRPSEEVISVLRRLVILGVDIWPGKGYLI
jgi:hypothetical protein